jgi:hypothetical protein
MTLNARFEGIEFGVKTNRKETIESFIFSVVEQIKDEIKRGI